MPALYVAIATSMENSHISYNYLPFSCQVQFKYVTLGLSAPNMKIYLNSKI